MAAERLDEARFWRSISVLIKNYHVLNKNIFEVLITRVQNRQHGKLHESTEAELEEQLKASTKERTSEGFTISYKMLTKRVAPNILANATVDFCKWTYACHFIDGTAFNDFIVQLNNGQVEVVELSQGQEDKCEQNSRWAQYVLKPKLYSWAQIQWDNKCQKSLHLLNVEMYNELYKELKQRHSERLLNYWQAASESTDPLKYIYEDLAIAAYLITLWNCTQQQPTAFADLGCGNGLLVHILNAEGFKGYGYDVRKRKLWSLYPEQSNGRLIEQTVDPKTYKLDYQEINWLIGNHSDELSPWLPVLAARFKASYFLLPCCPFELSGEKFQRRNTSISAYQDFMLYAREISDKCGFKTLQDRLKIPSTKRLALIGLQQSASAVHDLNYFVEQELQKHKVSSENTVKLREKVEIVRNCTQVERHILDDLVLKIFRMLLNNARVSDINTDNHWDSGQQLTMHDIAKGLTKSELKGIKSECGGIKTLLRNKHEVFQFCGADRIGIRKPTVAVSTGKAIIKKKRLCFFKVNHPQGCPLEASDCSFIH